VLARLAADGRILRDGARVAAACKKLPAAPETAASARGTRAATIIEEGVRRNVTRAAAESPLDGLLGRVDKAGRPLLAEDEWAAGDRLRIDFTRAQMLPGIGMRWTPTPAARNGAAGGGVAQGDAAMAARARVARALDAVGPELSGLLVDVCCFLKGLETVEAERGWPARSARLMLRAGLAMLARHYAPPPAGPAPMRHWGAPDHRPEIGRGEGLTPPPAPAQPQT
jgi:hypothetical protein